MIQQHRRRRPTCLLLLGRSCGPSMVPWPRLLASPGGRRPCRNLWRSRGARHRATSKWKGGSGTTVLEGGHRALFLLNIWYLVFPCPFPRVAFRRRPARPKSRPRAIVCLGRILLCLLCPAQGFAVLVCRHTRLRTRFSLEPPDYRPHKYVKPLVTASRIKLINRENE